MTFGSNRGVYSQFRIEAAQEGFVTVKAPRNEFPGAGIGQKAGRGQFLIGDRRCHRDLRCTHLRKLCRINKRYLRWIIAFNLSLILRKLTGWGGSPPPKRCFGAAFCGW